MADSDDDDNGGKARRTSRVLINGAVQFTVAHLLQLAPVLVILTASWVSQSAKIEANKTEVSNLRVELVSIRSEMRTAIDRLVESRDDHNIAMVQLNARLDGELSLVTERLNNIISRLQTHDSEERSFSPLPPRTPYTDPYHRP